MKKYNAFTLAETLIVLVILGIIASITIPAVVRRQMEANNRARIKKSMTVYDTAINKFIVENDLKSDAAVYQIAPKNNCTFTSQYFKAVENIEENGNQNLCKFKSADGVWWDISDILNPIIGLNKDDLTDVNSNTSFKLSAKFDQNGSLRVDDLAYEIKLNSNDLKALEKIYAFINGEKNEKINPYANREFKIKSITNNDCYELGDSGESSWYCDNVITISTSTGEEAEISVTCNGTKNEAKNCSGTYLINNSGPANFDKLPINENGDWISYSCNIENKELNCFEDSGYYTLDNGMKAECPDSLTCYFDGTTTIQDNYLGEISITCNQSQTCNASAIVDNQEINFEYTINSIDLTKEKPSVESGSSVNIFYESDNGDEMYCQSLSEYSCYVYNRNNELHHFECDYLTKKCRDGYEF